jgi:8-oxo-dGTP pyrophosphatase MutT (NUDIX family)
MWIISEIGFFSIVQKPGDERHGTLTIRARSRDDLDRLRARYMPRLGHTVAGEGTDYPYRAIAPREDVQAALAEMAGAIDYPNFKSAVAERHSKSRAGTYAKVWDALYEVQGTPPHRTRAATGKDQAYGLVVATESQVLLREPRGHFGGYVWTFAKGRRDPNETPWDCALREHHEETGVSAEVVATIPGQYEGDVTTTRYFLAKPTEPVGTSGPVELAETQSLRWATWDEAASLLRQTTSEHGRTRDLAVLAAAREMMAERSRTTR